MSSSHYSSKTIFLLKIFGLDDLNFYVDQNYSIKINHKSKTYSINPSQIQKIIKKNNLFTSDMILNFSEGNVVFNSLSKKQFNFLFLKINLLKDNLLFKQALSDFEGILKFKFYVNRKKIINWKNKYQNIYELIQKLEVDHVSSEEKKFLEFYNSIEKVVDKKNIKFIKDEKDNLKSFFDKLEDSPLTEAQRDSIVTDDDANLIVAGAGTGKTSTVMGKMSYLIKQNIVQPKEILALAYGKDAAAEMRDRVEKNSGKKIEIRTFHSFGLNLMQNILDEKIKISDVALYDRSLLSLIAQIIAEMMKNNKTKNLVFNFISKHRYPAKYLEDFNKEADYFRYLRKFDPETLEGVRVKSFEELLIADWLTLNGISYEYERPYEIQTASRLRNQYRPDFFIRFDEAKEDKGIYLEHFGIGKDGKTAPQINSVTYNQGIVWKRNQHKKNGTTLIETYSWERQEGVLLDNLKKKLELHGIKCDPNNPKIVKKLINQRNVNQKLISLIKDFLNVFKEGQYTEKELYDYSLTLSKEEKDRCECFLQLFFEVFKIYTNYLKRRKEIDFADLIVYATDAIKNNKVKLNFKRIIVDEYQDISRGRFRMLKSIIDQSEDCRIMCVGDDWQSIYGFAGSDIKMTLEFENLVGYFSRIDLDKTFRFSQPILNVSSKFIQKNPNQLKKNIIANESKVEKPIEIYFPDPGKEINYEDVFKLIDKERPKNKTWEVLLLGRYNFTNPEIPSSILNKFKKLNIKFMTIHKSKGLGADAVVILDLTAGRLGFPGHIESDPLMKMVIAGEKEFENSEERRVFYVGITRAKQKIILCTDAFNQSEFVNELLNDEYPEVFSQTLSEVQNFICPKCHGGSMILKYPNRLNGYAWRCSLHPYCDGKAKFCENCKTSPKNDYNICLNINCRPANSLN